MPPEQGQQSALEEPLLSSEEASSDPDSTAAESAGEDDHEDDDSKNIVVPFLKCGKPLRMNHNVFLNLILAILYGVSDSLWNGTANAAYLKKIGGDKNGPLGDIEAANGLAAFISALPVGYLADRIGRSKVIAAGGILMMITTAAQIGLLQWVGVDEDSARVSSNTPLWIMGFVMASWGMADGVINGPAAALFADSTPVTERSKYYTYLFSCYIGASAVGPLVSIALFETLGDSWDLYHIRIVIYVGLGIALLGAIVGLTFDDSKALEEPEESDNDDNEEANSNATGDDATEPLLTNDDHNDDHNDEERAPEASTVDDESTPTSLEAARTLKRRQKWIPYIIFIQGVVLATGSGMTVKFFPLFFKDEVGMTPSQVQVIYVLVPLCMVIFSNVSSKMSAAGFGRVQTRVLFNCIGVLMLFSMVFFKSFLDIHPFVLVPIYILRTAFMNCTYPLQESILMEFVPKNERARWKSLDSVAVFGWCGSAAIGGWLSDKFDYTYTFLITAIVQCCGILLFSTLLPLVPRKEGGSVEH